jgi:predicted AlkP superfamily pyrophosphatase or phosphodiesterase
VHKTVVINAVGLTPSLISDHTPRLKSFASRHRVATIGSVLPAVTTTVQSTYLTGKWPSEHGIVGNGWYFRDECEVKFWKQSNKLVQSPKIWDVAKKLDPTFSCANLFWWYAMYSGADVTVTPRPMYPADGRKLPDVWTEPGELRGELQKKLGQFPLFKFWGPATSIESTRWITSAAIEVDREHDATLTLIYLPHLDYNFQRFGPGDPRCISDVKELDAEIGRLIDYFSDGDTRVIILSEYGITPVSRPIHINRLLRRLNLISVRVELGLEVLDPGDSQAFAVADHQVAHVYVNDPRVTDLVVRELKQMAGVAHVYAGDARRIINLDHPRSGEVIAIAEPDAWFTYYYWLDDAVAPDFARTVDIHRKPGYDPVELFTNASKAKIAAKLLKRKLGFRALLDVIPLDARVVKGSHGRPAGRRAEAPRFISKVPSLLPPGDDEIPATDVMQLILRYLTS